MKSLKQFIKEGMTAKSWKEIKDKSEVTLEMIEEAPGFGSFMDDRTWVVIDGASGEKIDDSRWQFSSNQARVLSGTINNKKVFDKIQDCKEFKLMIPQDVHKELMSF